MLNTVLYIMLSMHKYIIIFNFSHMMFYYIKDTSSSYNMLCYILKLYE